ncbi:aspartate aminotransferase [Betaproteobacteria bacterium]|nr:aspartate aminotransferase [Betaproteobacteria bacterium]GHU41603.1 aspartate aminotransferase [Betaproteobacteria bacterium]
MFDLTHTPDRRASDSMKWGKYAGRDILPLWVADMDFAAPPAVLDAVQQRLAHSVLGYGVPQPSQVEAVLMYLERQYDWRIQAEWLVWLPGLVTGIHVACRSAGGGVLTNTPVYPPFLAAPCRSDQALRRAPLVCRAGHWEMDTDALEAALLQNPDTKLLLFCHPHNPVGRCWQQAELEWVADFAARHHLIVCSDEIHCDLILDADKRHLPFARLNDDAAKRSVTLMSPSKTYNIPGLACAFAVIPDTELRQRFVRVMSGIVPHVNLFGLVACEAAFRDCEDWRQALLATLRQNRDRLAATVAQLPGVSMTHIEATYLAWLDVRQLHLANPVAYFESQGLGFSNGADFGAAGWVRLNFGCAPELLDHALVRLQQAIENVTTAPRA